MNYKHINSVILPIISSYIGRRLSIDELSVVRFGNKLSKVNYVYRVFHGLKSYIVKFSDNIATTSGRPLVKRHLWHEYKFLKLLTDKYADDVEAIGINIPKPIFFDKSINAILMEDIGGSNVSINDITDRQIVNLAKLLLLFHNIEIPEDLFDSLSANNPIITLSEFKFNNFKKCLNENLLCPYETKKFIIGDFSPNNILAAGEMTNVVDFDFISIGDPSYDVANFLSFIYIQSCVNKTFLKYKSERLIRNFTSEYFVEARQSNFIILQNINKYLSPLLMHRFWRYQQKNHDCEIYVNDNLKTFAINLYMFPVSKVEDLYDKNLSFIREFIQGTNNE